MVGVSLIAEPQHPIDLYKTNCNNIPPSCILCKPNFQQETQLLDRRLVVCVLCVFYVGLLDARTCVPKQQKLECAKILHLPYHLSKDVINEVDQKQMILCITIKCRHIKIMHLIPPNQYHPNAYYTTTHISFLLKNLASACDKFIGCTQKYRNLN